MIDNGDGTFTDPNTGDIYDSNFALLFSPNGTQQAGSGGPQGPVAFSGPGGAAAGQAPGADYGAPPAATPAPAVARTIDTGNEIISLDYQGNVVSRFPKSQTPNEAAAASRAASGASVQNAQTAAGTAAANLAEQKRQFDLSQTTPNASQQGTLQNQQAQTALQQSGLSGQLPNGQQTLAGQQQQFNQFQSLAQLAANPRNYMQNFFEHRGFQPPANVGAYGTQAGAPGAGTTGGGYTMPSFITGGGGSPNSPIGTNQTLGPDSTGGSVNRSLIPPGSTPPPAGVWQGVGTTNLTPQSMMLSGPGANAPIIGGPTQYGGPGSGPAQTAIVGHAPLPGEPGYRPPEQLGAGEFQGAGNTGLDRGAPVGYLGYAHGGITPEPIMGVGMHSNPELWQALQNAPGHKYLIGEHGPEGVVPASYLPKFLQSRAGQQTIGQPSAGQQSAYADGGPLGIPSSPRPTYPMQDAMRTPLSPMAGMGVTSSVSGYADGGDLGMPSDTNPYGTASSSGSPYDQLNQAGAVPPFLSRALGQSQGDQSVGTNVPQKAYLPPQLPLESQLGYNQMDPSEQQALQSYASSLGIDPTDYLAQIQQQTAPARARQTIAYTGQ